MAHRWEPPTPQWRVPGAGFDRREALADFDRRDTLAGIDRRDGLAGIDRRGALASVDRRTALAGLAACWAAALPGRAPAQARAERHGASEAPRVCVLTPSAGEGPFYFDPALVRADITEGLPGAPLEMTLQVLRAGDCATLDGARVDLWHADALGLYSGYERQRGTGEPSRDVTGATFLRGTQLTNADGRVTFRTIYPSWYAGRTPHVHFKVFLGGREVVASQVFFPEDFNEEVFASYDPYRERRARRRTFNSNDRFLQGSVEGVFCDIERVAGPAEGDAGYRATAVVAVARMSG